jgi:lipopolysaccharide cholinephosphotransferase
MEKKGIDNIQFEFPQGNEILKRLQEIEFEMAVVIKDIFNRNGIRFVVEYGTLLGAVRHGGFIPWDDDFDFVVLEDDYEKASAALRRELPPKYILHDKESDPSYFYSFSKVRYLFSKAVEDGFTENLNYQGISADLFKGRIERNNRFARSLFLAKGHTQSHWRKFRKGNSLFELGKAIICGISTCFLGLFHAITPKKPYFRKSPDTDQYFIPLEKYLPFSEVVFNGVIFPAPHDPDFVLKDRYGDWTKCPEKISFHLSHVEFYAEQA